MDLDGEAVALVIGSVLDLMDCPPPLPLFHSEQVGVCLGALLLALSELRFVDFEVLHRESLAFLERFFVRLEALLDIREKRLGEGMVEAQNVSVCALSLQPFVFELDSLLELVLPLLLFSHTLPLLCNFQFVLLFTSVLLVFACNLDIHPAGLSLGANLDHMLLFGHVRFDHLLLLLPVCTLRRDQFLLVFDLLVFLLPVFRLDRDRFLFLLQSLLLVDNQVGLVLVL
mmetsp:Transcript_4637/g.10905  ORF Transcript_4637/g.10905 Transcript_4637/m.10905 type:complete len:228 (+) Transcript_4637:1959-2642(+)